MSSGSTIVYELNHVLSSSESWSDPSNIISGVSALIALVLIFFAYRTLVKTSEQAQAATKQLALSSRPYLTFGKIGVQDQGSRWYVTIRVENRGQVPLVYKQKIALFNNKILSLAASEPCIFQNCSSDMSFGIPKGEAKGIYTNEVAYWALGNKDEVYIRRKSIKINLDAPQMRTEGEVIEEYAT